MRHKIVMKISRIFSILSCIAVFAHPCDGTSTSCGVEGTVSINTCSQTQINCTARDGDQCGDGGEETYCCEDETQICIDYGNAVSNGQCVGPSNWFLKPLNSVSVHHHTFCSYFVDASVELVNSTTGSLGMSCSMTADRRVIMRTPLWSEYGDGFATSGDLQTRINRGSLPPDSCEFACATGYTGATVALKCDMNALCTDALSSSNACSPGPAAGGPYISNNETGVAITDGGADIVCTENECAAITFASGFESPTQGGTTCESGMVLRPVTSPTSCVIRCNTSAGYKQSGTQYSCPSSLANGSEPESVTGSALVCELQTCDMVTITDFPGADFVNASIQTCRTPMVPGESCAAHCEAGYAPSSNTSSSTFDLECTDLYAIESSSVSCTLCSTGKFSASGSLECTACAANTYAENTGSTSCLECPSGSYASAGSPECTPCAWIYALENGRCETPVLGILLAIVGAILVAIAAYYTREQYQKAHARKVELKKKSLELQKYQHERRLHFLESWERYMRSCDWSYGIAEESSRVETADDSDVDQRACFVGTLHTTIMQQTLVHRVTCRRIADPKTVNKALARKLRQLTIHDGLIAFLDCVGNDIFHNTSARLRRFDTGKDRVPRLWLLSNFVPRTLEDVLRGKKREHKREGSFMDEHDVEELTSKQIQRSLSRVGWPQRLRWLSDVAGGLQWLHDHDHVHGNVQLSNIRISMTEDADDLSDIISYDDDVLSRAKVADLWELPHVGQADDIDVDTRAVWHVKQVVAVAKRSQNVAWAPPEFLDFDMKASFPASPSFATKKKSPNRTSNLASAVDIYSHDQSEVCTACGLENDSQQRFPVCARCGDTWCGFCIKGKMKRKMESVWIHAHCERDFFEDKTCPTYCAAAFALMRPNVDAFGIGKVMRLLCEKSHGGIFRRKRTSRRAPSSGALSMSRASSSPGLLTRARSLSSEPSPIDVSDQIEVEINRDILRLSGRCLRKRALDRPSCRIILQHLSEAKALLEVRFANSNNEDDSSASLAISATRLTDVTMTQSLLGKGSTKSVEEQDDTKAPTKRQGTILTPPARN